LAAKRTRTRVIGGYNSTREGNKRKKSFYYILFTHLGFNGEKWLHELLGREAMWFLISCNLYKHLLWVVWGFSIHGFSSSFFIHSCSWLGHGNELLRKEAIVLLAIVIIGVFQP
jgi:hypothetical protein